MAAGTNPLERDPAEPPLTPALYLLDRNGRVTGWNEAAECDSGCAPDELRGLALDKVFAPETEQPRIAVCLRIARRQGRSGSRGWFARKDGSRCAVNLTVERI